MPRRREIAAAATRTGCELKGWGYCQGPIDPHEVVGRGVRPGSHLEPELVIGLCRGHHGLITVEPALGERVGARMPSWAYIKWGQVALTEAARRRAWTRAAGRPIEAPTWAHWEPGWSNYG